MREKASLLLSFSPVVPLVQVIINFCFEHIGYSYDDFMSSDFALDGFPDILVPLALVALPYVRGESGSSSYTLDVYAYKYAYGALTSISKEQKSDNLVKY